MVAHIASMNAAVAVKIPAMLFATKKNSNGPRSRAIFKNGFMAGRPSCAGSIVIELICPCQCFCECVGIENLQIADAFPYADVMNRQFKAVCERHQNPALRRAVELGHDEGRQWHGGAERLDLRNRVL